MEQVFMKRALELAKNGLGATSPNPCVGAVIVKGGKIVAEGWHRRAGDPHAEIVAIGKLMKKSEIKTMDIDPALFNNASLYITLEPCCHQGRTNPCVNALIKANFQKVCIGMKDPYKKVNGRSIAMLKKAHIKVEVCNPESVLAREIRMLNQPFLKSVTKGLPYVTLKAGMSLDGNIATSSGESKWITSDESRMDAYMERSLCDAVIVGAGTVIADDSKLGAHGNLKRKKLIRIIIDRSLSSPVNACVFRDKKVFVACTNLAPKKAIDAYKEAGIDFRSFGEDDISVKRLLNFLSVRGVQSVFVEGGSRVFGTFHDAELKSPGLVDRILFYVAPKIIGGEDALSIVGGKGVSRLSKIVDLEDLKVDPVGKDFKMEGVYRVY